MFFCCFFCVRFFFHRCVIPSENYSFCSEIVYRCNGNERVPASNFYPKRDFDV